MTTQDLDGEKTHHHHRKPINTIQTTLTNIKAMVATTKNDQIMFHLNYAKSKTLLSLAKLLLLLLKHQIRMTLHLYSP